MTATALHPNPESPPAPPDQHPTLDVVVPVYNEEAALEQSIRTLRQHLASALPYSFRITIADNASVDHTPLVGRRLARDLANVSYVRLEQKGRGRALKTVWQASDAEVLAYMDVDLSTDLAALLPLVAPLISGHSDLAIGTRLARESRVVRGAKREFVSRSYNLILKTALAAKFSDAQCGFKAIRADVAQRLLPLIEDHNWFFDTEMLVLAQRSGLRVHEVPVDWVDDPDSRVDIVATAVEDLKGVARLGRGLLTGSIPLASVHDHLGRPPLTSDDGSGTFAGQLVRFLAIGVASTMAYALLYVLARQWWTPQTANLVALLVTAVANTAANRRLTFGVRGRSHAVRHHAQGLAVFALGLALTSGSLAALVLLAPDAPRPVELTVLVGANLLTTIVRFLALRIWVFAQHRAPSDQSPINLLEERS